ncbi:MAG: leucine-rich repeat protein [Muribaculaceae bacterium]|nr:leucine-rich repeat protein [Muribaculaceae bacterium]
MKKIHIQTKHLCTLAVMLLAGLFTATAADFVVDGISYNVIGENEVEVTKHDEGKYEGEVIVPSSVVNDGVTYQVTRIGSSAFSYSTDLLQVGISEGVTEIKRNAFSSCNNLESVEFPNSLERIEEYVFTYCYAITNFYFPKNVSYIDQYAFYACPNISSFMCSGLNPNFKTVNGVLYSKDMTRLLLYPSGAPATTFDIPSTVTRIEAAAFSSNDILVQVNFPESVTWMGNGVFRDCDNLETVELSDGIHHMGPMMFYHCDKLAHVKLPASLDTICNGSFMHLASLQEIVIPRNVKFIDDFAFSESPMLEKVTFEEGSILDGIGLRVFEYCYSLDNFDMPNSVTWMDGQAFGDCTSLKNVHLSDNLTIFGNSTFWGCTSIVEGVIPGKVISIKNAYVECTSLKRVKIGDKDSAPGVTLIKNCGVSRSPEVEYIELGANVDSLETSAFAGVNNLKVVVCWAATPPRCHDYWSSFSPSPNRLNATLYVPQASLEAYSSAYDWRDFPVIAAIEYVGDLNFNGSLDVTDVTMMINLLMADDPGEFAPYADVNLDGRIDITDITTLINRVVNSR